MQEEVQSDEEQMVIAEETTIPAESIEIDLKCAEKVTDSDVEDSVFKANSYHNEKHSEPNEASRKTWKLMQILQFLKMEPRLMMSKQPT